MLSRFSRQVPLSNRSFELLPFFHTCDGFDARSHIERSQIVADDECEIFKEKLVYLFYGRSAYKYAPDEESSTNVSLYPVCFASRLDPSSPVKRLFPFDTGALYYKRLSRFIHKKNTILDFEMGDSVGRVKDIVLHFFGSNNNYLLSKASGADHEISDFESISYTKMIESFMLAESDERRVTLEAQIDTSFRLNKQTIIGMVIPTPLRDSPLFSSFIDTNGATLESYDIDVWNPAQSFGLVAAASKRLILRLGLLK